MNVQPATSSIVESSTGPVGLTAASSTSTVVDAPASINPGPDPKPTGGDMTTIEQDTVDLVKVFSLVPWMRFSVVAQPDLTLLANNDAIKKFIADMTSLTITAVSKEIHDEITDAVNQVIQNIAKNVDKKIQAAQQDIMKQIVGVTAECSATAYEPLGLDHMNDMLKALCRCDEPSDITPPPTIISPPPPPPPPPVPSMAPPPNIKLGSWIWTSEAKTNPGPPKGQTRAFRRTVLTETPVNALTIDVVADDMYTAYVNGKLVGCGMAWDQPDRYTITFEETSRVVVAIIASQGPGLGNVGLLSSFKVWNTHDANPMGIEYSTDPKWLTFASGGVSDKCIDPDFVDSSWSPAYVVAAYGGLLWTTTKPAAPGLHPGGRIHDIAGIPNAPEAPVAEQWKI